MKIFALQVLMLTFFISQLSAQKKSYVDLMFGVDYSDRTNRQKEDFVFTDENGDILNSNINISGTTSIRFGLSYNHPIGKKIWIKTGLRYTSFGNKLEVAFLDDGGFENIKSNSEIHNSFIEIPLLLRYEFTNTKWSPYVELGMAANFYLQSKQINSFQSSTQNSKTEEKDKIETINQGQYSVIAGIGCKYQLNERFQITIQPTFRYFLTEHLDKEMVPNIKAFDFRYYSLGLEMGCRMMI